MAGVLLAAATALHAGVDRWTPLGPDGGDSTLMAIDPQHIDTLYLVAGGGRDAGLYRSFDAGTRWDYLRRAGAFTGEIIQRLVVDPHDSRTLYAGVRGTDLEKSTDGGRTWQRVLADAAYSFAVDPVTPGTLYAMTYDYSLQKSVDGGATWQLLAAGIVYNLPQTGGGGTGWEILVAPTEPRTIYIGYSYQTLRSVDGGHTWGVVGPWNLEAFALGALDHRVVFARVTYGDCGARSEDGGATFVQIPNPPGTYCGAFAFDPRAPRRLYAATGSDTSKVLLTEDDGVTWTERSKGLPRQFVAAFLKIDPSNSNRLYLGTYDDGLYTSRDGGRSWQSATRGFTSRTVRWVTAIGDPPLLFANDYRLHRSADFGRTWTEIGASDPELAFYIPSKIIAAPGRSGRLYMAEARGVWVSGDRGLTWLLLEGSPQSLAFVAVDPRRPRTIYTGGLHGVAKSTDGGETWMTRNDGLIVPEPCEDETHCSPPFARNLIIDPANSSRLYLIWNSELYSSHDAAISWTRAENPLPAGTHTLVRAAGESGAFYAAAGCAGIFRSTDNAITWQHAGGFGSREVPICVTNLAPAPDNPSILAAATDGGGVYRTTDAGNTWTAIVEGLPARYISDVAWDPSTPTRLYATTDGAGLMTTNLVDAPTITLGDRFHLAAAWREKKQTGAALPAPFSSRAATFSYFETAQPDLAVKLLDGAGVNGHTWWFGASLSHAEGEVTIADAVTGATRNYLVPAGAPSSDLDLDAFATPSWFAAEASADAALALDLSLVGGRFDVKVEWRDESGVTTAAQAVQLSDQAGAFVFFQPDNPEVVVKLIDGTALNGKFWMFAGGLSSLEYRIVVTDRQSGAVRTYAKPEGELGGFADTSAF